MAGASDDTLARRGVPDPGLARPEPGPVLLAWGAAGSGQRWGHTGGPVLTGLFPGQAQELKDTIAFLRDSSLAPN